MADDFVLNIVDEPTEEHSKKRKRQRNLKPSLQKLEALLHGRDPKRLKIKPHPRAARTARAAPSASSSSTPAPSSTPASSTPASSTPTASTSPSPQQREPLGGGRGGSRGGRGARGGARGGPARAGRGLANATTRHGAASPAPSTSSSSSSSVHSSSPSARTPVPTATTSPAEGSTTSSGSGSAAGVTPSGPSVAASAAAPPARVGGGGAFGGGEQEKRKRLPRRERFVNYEFKESDVFSGDSFSAMGLADKLVTHMKGECLSIIIHPPQQSSLITVQKMHLDKPTHIQRASVPHLLEGKDVLIKAETGSGKTLAYLLPIVQMLQALPTRVQRTEGAYAIVVAPTRELSLQIYDVLHRLVQPFHWIVPGIVMGGEKKKSEKARLRRGVTILVATPGRLLDHLQNTASFKVDNLRYLVMDEADRLLDMGFDRDVKQIVKTLDEKVRESGELAALASDVIGEDGSVVSEPKAKAKAGPTAGAVADAKAEKPHRQTALISATLNSEIKRLVGTVMRRGEPVYVSVTKIRDQALAGSAQSSEAKKEKEKKKEEVSIEQKDDAISTPRGLDQSYAIVPCKKRLVTLAAFLQWQATSKKDCKLIVFTSSIASVEFFYTLFGRTLLPDYSKASKGGPQRPKNGEDDDGGEEEEGKEQRPDNRRSQQLLNIPLYKLHGDLSQVDRTKVYFSFCKADKGILFCTDVAARGLDLPAVNWIVQYDPPAEPSEYIHRVGRTARLGHCGRALIFLLPTEETYAELLQTQYQLSLHKVSTASILKTLPAPANKTDDFEGATLLQTHFEWMVKNDREGDLHDLAARAYGSFVRAYATHSAATKHIFHIKNLHLGHVAKCFALAEPPSKLYGKKDKKEQKNAAKAAAAAGKRRDAKRKEKEKEEGGEELDALKRGPQARQGQRISTAPKKRRLQQMSEFAAF